MNLSELKLMRKETKKEMQRMAKEMNFIEAARLRDEILEIENKIKKNGQ